MGRISGEKVAASSSYGHVQSRRISNSKGPRIAQAVLAVLLMGILVFLITANFFLMNLDESDERIRSTTVARRTERILVTEPPPRRRPPAYKPSIITNHSFRIYVYDNIPAELNSNIRDRKDCRASYAAAEIVIPDLLIGTDVYTRNGELADFYLVPVLSNCYMMERAANGTGHREAVASLNKLFSKLLDDIIYHRPFFSRTEGRDHIFLFPSEAGPSLIQAQSLSLIRKSMIVSGAASRDSPFFDTWKDVVVPSTKPSWGLKDDELPFDPLEGPRPTLLHFRGSSQAVNGDGLRANLETLLAGEDDVIFGGSDVCSGECSLREMVSSMFCLCPRGVEGWSTRILEALWAGCIPVIVADEYELPYEFRVIYTNFTLKFADSDAQSRTLLNILRELPSRIVTYKQKDIRKAWESLRYHSTWREGDAFDLFLEELDRRVRTMRHSARVFWT